MTNKTEDKFYFGNAGTKAESELTVRITKMLREVEQARLSRNELKAKATAAKVRGMIRKSSNTSIAKMQMEELASIMQGLAFAREGKPERFGMAEQVMRDGSVHLDFSAARDYLSKQSDDGLRYIIKDAKAARDAMGTAGRKFHYYTDLVLEAQRELKKRGFSRPGQPERFARDHDMKMIAFRDRFFRSYGEAIREAANNPDSRSAKSDDAILRNAWSAMFQTGYAESIAVLNGLSGFMKPKASVSAMKKAANDAMTEYAAYKRAALAELGKHRSSRPGQPDKFDASSLERGSFAEASKSPILGKLLSEKAMPEGGWRAVQAGSDTLVISFEDGDVAGNFARRVAGKGYSATSPVQAIGRYWNVEVKNG